MHLQAQLSVTELGERERERGSFLSFFQKKRERDMKKRKKRYSGQNDSYVDTFFSFRCNRIQIRFEYLKMEPNTIEIEVGRKNRIIP